MYLFKYYFFKLLEKMTKNSQCGCQSPLFIHKRSSMDSSTDSFVTVAQIRVVIYLCIVNPLSAGIGLCTSNINKERFVLESAHYRKFFLESYFLYCFSSATSIVTIISAVLLHKLWIAFSLLSQ